MTIYDKLDDLNRIRYPFVEDSELDYTSVAGDVTLPNSLVLDASISAYAGDYPDCYLSGIRADGVGFLVLDWSVCGELVTLAVPAAGLTGPMPFMASDQVSGWLLFDNAGIASVSAMLTPATQYDRADSTVGVLEARCIVYSPGGAVLSLLGNAPGSSEVTGHVEVVDGVNTRVRISTQQRELVITAEPGIGLPNCLKQVVEEGDDVLRMFNGAKADASGNARISTDGRVTLLPSADGSELELGIASDIAALLDCTPLLDPLDNPEE